MRGGHNWRFDCIHQLVRVIFGEVLRKLRMLNQSQHNKHGLLTKFEVKMAGYQPTFLLFLAFLWTKMESGPLTCKKRTGQLDRTSLIKKEFIIWLLRNFFLAGHSMWSQAGKIVGQPITVHDLIHFAHSMSQPYNNTCQHPNMLYAVDVRGEVARR